MGGNRNGSTVLLSVADRSPVLTGAVRMRASCTLGILPPNLVAMVGALNKRGLIRRTPHPRDGRAMSLHLTPPGEKLMREAEKTANQLEREATIRLSAAECDTLMRLLRKIYL